ncbi:MAG: hypothetical protein ACTSW1_08050 [Candidatus Hodarchaeales archaeon]
MKMRKEYKMIIIFAIVGAIAACLRISTIKFEVGSWVFFFAVVAILAAVYGHEHVEEENGERTDSE